MIVQWWTVSWWSWSSNATSAIIHTTHNLSPELLHTKIMCSVRQLNIGSSMVCNTCSCYFLDAIICIIVLMIQQWVLKLIQIIETELWSWNVHSSMKNKLANQLFMLSLHAVSNNWKITLVPVQSIYIYTIIPSCKLYESRHLIAISVLVPQTVLLSLYVLVMTT